ncbi:MAG: DUF4214 domain-containing protein [Telluria sp.]
MATTYYNDLQKLYVAYFNRPADAGGLANYEAQLEAAGTDTKAIAATMARISAEFASSTEYKANFTGMSNADIVNTVYMNLFGRPADDSGKKFYADNLTAGKLTIDAVVTEVAKGAQGSDATAYANKVTAAAAFTAKLSATDSYNTQAAATAAKAFLSGVTDNASLAIAVDPVYLQVAITKVNAAAQPFSLQTGLAAVTAANTVKVNFLDAADGKVDGKFAGTAGAVAQAAAETKIGTDVTAKAADVAAIVDSNVAANEQGLYADTTINAAVKAALLAEAKTNLAADLSDAQAAVTADNTAIAAVPGLNTAITTLSDATKAATAAATADTAAHTAVAVAFAAYNAQNTATVTAPASGLYADQVTAVASLISADSTGKLSLKSTVTEAKNPGVTALLNALVAEKTADTALTGANTAKVNAQASVDFLDGTPAYETALKAVAAGMTLNKIPAGTLPTDGQISAELAGLLAAKTAADAGTDATAKANAAAAYTNFNTLVNNFHAADGTNTLSVNLTTHTQNVSDAQDAISALNDALAALSTATTAQAQLNAVNAQVTAATNAFAAHGLMAPVMLDVTTAATATFGADIFVANTKNATIGSFDMNGVDSLYIGSKFTTLNTDLTKGNDAALEAFITKDSGGNVVISLETKAFASSEATTADLVQITLTGVTDVTKVHLNNGIITVS